MRGSHLVFALSIMLPSPAIAETPPNLAAEAAQTVGALKAEQAKAPALKQEADRLSAANESLLKEGKLYQEQIRVRLGPIASAVRADAGRLQADTQRHNQGVAVHNRHCTGTLPQPQYQKCMGEKAYWDRNKANLDSRKAQLQARANDHDRQLRQYNARIQQISAQMKRNFAAWQQRKQALEQVEARIKDYAARLGRVCNLAVQAKNRGEPGVASNAEEALQHCHSVNWDGSNPNLPPLIDVRPPSRTTPN